MPLRNERIKTLAEETVCDHCRRYLAAGDACAVDLATGLIFCDRRCAKNYGAAEAAELIEAHSCAWLSLENER